MHSRPTLGQTRALLKPAAHKRAPSFELRVKLAAEEPLTGSKPLAPAPPSPSSSASSTAWTCCRPCCSRHCSVQGWAAVEVGGGWRSGVPARLPVCLSAHDWNTHSPASAVLLPFTTTPLASLAPYLQARCLVRPPALPVALALAPPTAASSPPAAAPRRRQRALRQPPPAAVCRQRCTPPACLAGGRLVPLPPRCRR